MKIPLEIIPLAYETAKKVYDKKMTLKVGKLLIAGDRKVNLNSSADYINNYKYLVEGKKFSRTLNYPSMEYFLENIYLDKGIYGLDKALQALKLHIEYYEEIQNTRMTLMRKLLSKFQTSNSLDISNLTEQSEIQIEIVGAQITKAEILRQLLNLKLTDGETVKFSGKTYKRDNVATALIKELRDFKCQFCGKFILKKDGSKYIEAAHINPKHLKGNESISNILLLCPNHHKEFDLGHKKIIEQTTEFIKIEMNGIKYKIEFES
jgi:5-methylcytosine-specific restriction enzyme A